MTHKEVFEKFKLYFPQFAESVETIFPSSKNSIRIRIGYLRDYIFTFNGERDWCFETVDSFIKRMKGEKR